MHFCRRRHEWETAKDDPSTATSQPASADGWIAHGVGVARRFPGNDHRRGVPGISAGYSPRPKNASRLPSRSAKAGPNHPSGIRSGFPLNLSMHVCPSGRRRRHADRFGHCRCGGFSSITDRPSRPSLSLAEVGVLPGCRSLLPDRDTEFAASFASVLRIEGVEPMIPRPSCIHGTRVIMFMFRTRRGCQGGVHRILEPHPYRPSHWHGVPGR